jgi:hypothetical protein
LLPEILAFSVCIGASETHKVKLFLNREDREDLKAFVFSSRSFAVFVVRFLSLPSS